MDGEDKNNTIYEAGDIQRILKIGKKKVYCFLEDVYSRTHYFKVIKIGKLYRVHKKSFDKWFNEE